MDQSQTVSLSVSGYLLRLVPFIYGTSSLIFNIHIGNCESIIPSTIYHIFPTLGLFWFLRYVLENTPYEHLPIWIAPFQHSVFRCFICFLLAQLFLNYSVFIGVLFLALGHGDLIENFSQQRPVMSEGFCIFIQFLLVTVIELTNIPWEYRGAVYYIFIPLTTFYKSVARVKLTPQRVACAIGCFLVLCSEFLNVCQKKNEVFAFLFPNFPKEAAALTYSLGLLGIALVVLPESSDYTN